jgi:hypothetical protein
MEVFIIKAIVALIVLALLIWAIQTLPVIDPTVKALIVVLMIVLVAVFIAKIGGIF